MSTSKTERPLWDITTARVACESGEKEVPALAHVWCPGIAVTMTNFGLFRVTHLATGRAMGAEYQRAASAALEAVEWAAIAREYGVPLDGDAEAVREAFAVCGDKPVPFPGATSTSSEGTRPQTVTEWRRMLRTHFAADEFPWEDRGPWDHATDLLDTLNPEVQS